MTQRDSPQAKPLGVQKTNRRGAELTGLFSDSVRTGLSEANSRTLAGGKRKKTCKTGEALCSQHDSTGLAAGKTAPSTNEQKAETKVIGFFVLIKESRSKDLVYKIKFHIAI
jgi:hypothetical protein